MRIVSVKVAEAPPPPVPPPVVSVLVELSRQEAQDLYHLLGKVGGQTSNWPQRSRTYDALYCELQESGAVNTNELNPLRFASGADSIYLA